MLVIEDNEDAADALSELIDLIGFDVDVAHDARSTLVRATATPPDLVLCDLGLPGGMDGYASSPRSQSTTAITSHSHHRGFWM